MNKLGEKPVHISNFPTTFLCGKKKRAYGWRSDLKVMWISTYQIKSNKDLFFIVNCKECRKIFREPSKVTKWRDLIKL